MLKAPLASLDAAGQRRVDDVGDVDVVAGLGAVAVHGRGLRPLQPTAEDRDHTRLAQRVLTRAVDVAQPQDHPREPVEASI